MLAHSACSMIAISSDDSPALTYVEPDTLTLVDHSKPYRRDVRMRELIRESQIFLYQSSNSSLPSCF